MRLDRLKHECMATDIMKRHGFHLTTPDESLVSAQIWEKGGRMYRFVGWENTPKTALMAMTPKYITMEEV